MKFLNEYKWQLVAISLFLGAIFSARGGAAALIPFARVLVPVIIAIFVAGFIKNKIANSQIGETFKKQMQNAMDAQKQAAGAGAGAGGRNKTIDLCSNCGSYDRPGHKCKPKKA